MAFVLRYTNYMIAITRQQFQNFPYHLVKPSPWPILTSVSLLILTLSAVMYFHGFPNGGYILNLGFVLTMSSMILWFRDIITEGTFFGDHTLQVQRGLTIGIILFIISEVCAFFSVFWAFFHSSLSPAIELGGIWPPQGIKALDPFGIPLLNTLLLLSSGAFITYGHHSLIEGNRRGAILGTVYTIIFAILFTGLQYYEYLEASFTIADSVFGTVFFASTGLHGLHVIVGTLFISVGLARIYYYHLTTSHHQGFEAAILYWQILPFNNVNCYIKRAKFQSQLLS